MLVTSSYGALERHGHIKLDAGVRERLLKRSAAMIDRMMAPTRAVACRPRPRRKPSRPRQQMPLRTFAEWDGAQIGEMEMDLVAHCGAANSGSYVDTLVLTDVVSGWTECAPLVVKSRELVVETVERLRQSLPFTLISLDMDNGTEFVNEVLVDYCSKRGICLTRSRPYLENDQAWVEQKNSAVVRWMGSYGRLEGITTAQALARLHASARLFVNFFQPSFKLASKERDGARVIKRYHAPATPAARLLESAAISPEIKAHLKGIAEKLDPLRLLDEIRAMQHHLAAVAKGERMRTPVKRDPDLSEFLAGLTLAWKAGELWPTHTTKPRPPRTWRSRIGPFEQVWPQINGWLEDEGRTGPNRRRVALSLAADASRTLPRRPAAHSPAPARRLAPRHRPPIGLPRPPPPAGTITAHATPPTAVPGMAGRGFTGTSQSRGARPHPPYLPPPFQGRRPG